MFKQKKVFYLLAIFFLIFSLKEPTFSQVNKEVSKGSSLISFVAQPPLSQDEILNRVKAARAARQDFDRSNRKPFRRRKTKP